MSPSIASWVKSLISGRRNRKSFRKDTATFRPRFEELERRDVPSVTVTNPTDQQNYDGNVVSFSVVATDSLNHSMTYSAAKLPIGLTINSTTGVISGTISATADIGSPYLSTVTATDDVTSDSDAQGFKWVIRQPTVSLTNPGAESNYDADTVSLPIVASDSGGNGLSYSATGLPAGLTIASGTGVISGAIPGSTIASSPYLVKVTATDGAANVSATVTFDWAVAPATWNWIGTGGGSQLFSDSANWSRQDDATRHSVPTAEDDAVVQNTNAQVIYVDPGFQGTLGDLLFSPGSNTTLALQRSLTVGGGTQASGRITGSQPFIIAPQGVFDWLGGTEYGMGGYWGDDLSGANYLTIVSANARMNIRTDAAHVLDGRIIDNRGEIHWTDAGVVTITSGSELRNSANSRFFAENTPNALPLSNISGSTQAGYGKFTLYNATLTDTNDGTLQIGVYFSSKSSTLNFQSGIAQLYLRPVIVMDANGNIVDTMMPRFENTTVNISANKRVEMYGVSDYSWQFVGNNTITGAGEFRTDEIVGETVTIELVSGTTTLSTGTTKFKDTRVLGEGNLVMATAMTMEGGSMIGIGTAIVQQNSSIEFFDSVTIGRAFTNNGNATYDSEGGIFTLDSVTFTNSAGATFTINELLALSRDGAGTFANLGTLTVNSTNEGITNVTAGNLLSQQGTLILRSGGLDIAGSFSQTGGETKLFGGWLYVNGDFTIGQGTRLTSSDAGYISALNVINSGTIGFSGTGGNNLQPPKQLLQIAKYEGQGGNFRQTATGTINITIKGNIEYDLIQIAAQVSLGGTINVTLVDGYDPSDVNNNPNNLAIVYTPIQFGSRPNPNTNRFTTVNEPNLFVESYGNTTFNVTYTP